MPTLSQTSNEATVTKDPPSMPEENISVNMDVLAKSGDMEWQPGKVLEVLKKGQKGKLNAEYLTSCSPLKSSNPQS